MLFEGMSPLKKCLNFHCLSRQETIEQHFVPTIPSYTERLQVSNIRRRNALSMYRMYLVPLKQSQRDRHSTRLRDVRTQSTRTPRMGKTVFALL